MNWNQEWYNVNMNEQNIDVNLIIQSFQDRLTQLTTENVIKDATIKHLTLQIQEMSKEQVKEK